MTRDTTTGAKFEYLTDLRKSFKDAKYKFKGNKASKGKHTVEFYSKGSLYEWIKKEYNIDYKTRLSSKLIPDEAVFCPQLSTLTIVEKKFQQTHGSADEKLQTANFKHRQFTKLLAGTGIKIRYVYQLNEWFNNPKYVDVLDFIEEEGHAYFIGRIPITYFK